MHFKSALLTAAAVAAFALPAAGMADTVFKWVDANGVTNYTTTPPPSSARKVEAVNASPAIASSYPSMPANEEAAYWRERRQREAADSMRDDRLRRDAEYLRQSQVRQQMASQYEDDTRRRAEESRRQAAFDQCMRERRLNCDSGGYDSYYSTPIVVARRYPAQPITSAAPFPVPGSPAVTNPTPGAPSMTGNATPGAFTTGNANVSTRPVERSLNMRSTGSASPGALR